MGYRIVYSERRPKKYRLRILILTLVFWGMFLGWTVRYWEQGRELLLDVLLPEESVEVLTDWGARLRDTPFMDSVTAFLETLQLETGEDIY